MQVLQIAKGIIEEQRTGQLCACQCKGGGLGLFMYNRCWTVDYTEEARAIVTHTGVP